MVVVAAVCCAPGALITPTSQVKRRPREQHQLPTVTETMRGLELWSLIPYLLLHQAEWGHAQECWGAARSLSLFPAGLWTGVGGARTELSPADSPGALGWWEQQGATWWTEAPGAWAPLPQQG